MSLADRLAGIDLVPLASRIQQVPAPTFAEARRARLVADLLRDAADVEVHLVEHEPDCINVYARVPTGGGDAWPRRSARPALLLSAHTDTVFPEGTDLTLRRDERAGRLYGPGLGDNSLAVAALVAVARALGNGADGRAPGAEGLACPLWIVANAGEEGLGDLRGIRAAIDWIGAREPGGIGGAIVLEGLAFGYVYHSGIAVRRHRLEVRTAGGHSWGDAGTPSALHELVRRLASITEIRLPTSPRTSLNVGVVRGGTSVNTIAAEASAEIDLRSETTEAVEALERRVINLLNRPAPGVEVRVVHIGSRPAGAIDVDHPLVRAAADSLASVGEEARVRGGSTDANALLDAGVPTVCVGVSTGGGAHRLDEYVDLAPVERGMRQLGELLPRAAAIASGVTAREGQ